jgi:hypothetical protein
MGEMLAKKVYWISQKMRKLRILSFCGGKNKTLLLLILLSGVFCLRNIFIPEGQYAEASEDLDDQWVSEVIIGHKKISLSKNAEKRKRVMASFANFYLPKEVNTEAPSNFEAELYGLVGNSPIREMVPQIARHNRQVAGLIVGIAKKESDWGRRSPSKGGSDCYNYWGYKGTGENGVSMGYACFGSAEEAVKTVAGRIDHFVGKKLNTPAKMVVWKCGSSCAWDNPKNVAKWITDVSVYYNQIAYNK